MYTFTNEEQNLFLKAIKEFKNRIDLQWDNGNGKKNKTSWADLRDLLAPITNKFNLILLGSTGSGKLPYAEDEFCSMCFFRKDLNPMLYPIEVQYGFYIWLGYFFKNSDFILRFGKGGKYNPLIDQTKAIKELENKKLEYYYKNYDELAKNFSNNFLSLVKAFNSQNTLDFENSNSTYEITEKSLGLELKLAYDNAREKEKVSNILLFGITKYSIINDYKLSPEKIINEAGLKDGHATELRKGMRVGKKLLDMQLLNTNPLIKPSKNNLMTSYPLNQILYGSPGTGKTYSTIDKALEILGIETKGMAREDKKQLFKDYQAKGQIEFVTFHQNYGYEEFVEGIKPKLDEDNSKDDLEYEIQEGIFKAICQKAEKNFIDSQNSQEKVELKPYVLIIDEINRGNISKIFGELITLIEPSKRIGADEELRVTLPYSQESFGVPNNLYIIGTMNTADRSITSLDTALRRRFEFIEMMPDSTKLSGKTIEGIKLDKLLQAINERIEFLYDREKTIGHTYLMDIDSLDGLKEVFQNKIIPLLQEYFYNDYETIDAVLNGNGMIDPSQKNSQTSQSEYLISSAFDKFINERGIEKKVFKIISKDSDIWKDVNTYKKIYEELKDNKTQSNNDETNTSEPSNGQ